MTVNALTPEQIEIMERRAIIDTVGMDTLEWFAYLENCERRGYHNYRDAGQYQPGDRSVPVRCRDCLAYGRRDPTKEDFDSFEAALKMVMVV